MWLGRRLAFGSALLAACLPALPATADARLQTFSLRVDGVQRQYATAPADRGVRPAGIFVGLHPGGRKQTGRSFERDLDLVRQLAPRGWVTVLPDARGGTFHAGDCCGADKGAADDLRFVERAVTATRRRCRARRGPVVAAGFSNGAFMAYRLACQTRLVSAIVVVAGLDVTGRPCRPQRPISVLHIHARDDRRVPYRGGRLLGAERASVPRLVRAWTHRGACARLRTRSLGTVEETRAVGCRRGVRVRSLILPAGGHAWPGAPGDAPAALDASAEMLRFLAR